MASLTLEGIVKRYPDADKDTLAGIDLDVKDGEFVVLVGPSGCGKSTLLRTIAGLEKINKGSIHIGDDNVTHLAPKERDIAMVFQSYALYPHMTVRRNMAFGLEVRKTPRKEIEKQVAEASKMLGLDASLDKLPKALSGGQRQRVAMGRAIVRRPRIFLFDEPLSNLDAALRTQMRVEIKRLHQRLETTMVYVTHDQIEAMTLADRIVVLNAGYLQQVGSPLELYHAPCNRFVAGFIGSPAMNFIEDGKVTGSGTTWNIELTHGALEITVPKDHQLTDGRKVVVGVRPQSITHIEKGKSGPLRGQVDVIETLGWESHVHLEVAGLPFLASVESAQAAPLRPGDTVTLTPDMNEVILFDQESDDALFMRPLDTLLQDTEANAFVTRDEEKSTQGQGEAP